MLERRRSRTQHERLKGNIVRSYRPVVHACVPVANHRQLSSRWRGCCWTVLRGQPNSSPAITKCGRIPVP